MLLYKHTSDAGGLECSARRTRVSTPIHIPPTDRHKKDSRDETADHRRARNARDDLRAGRRERTEDTDLDTERAQVREPADRIRRDRVRAVRERVRARGDLAELRVRDELVLDELRREQLGDAQDLVPGHAHEERDGVEDVAEDELEGQCVEAEAPADPGEQAVDHRDERDDGEHVRPAGWARGEYPVRHGGQTRWVRTRSGRRR